MSLTFALQYGVLQWLGKTFLAEHIRLHKHSGRVFRREIEFLDGGGAIHYCCCGRTLLDFDDTDKMFSDNVLLQTLTRCCYDNIGSSCDIYKLTVKNLVDFPKHLVKELFRKEFARSLIL